MKYFMADAINVKIGQYSENTIFLVTVLFFCELVIGRREIDESGN